MQVSVLYVDIATQGPIDHRIYMCASSLKGRAVHILPHRVTQDSYDILVRPVPINIATKNKKSTHTYAMLYLSVADALGPTISDVGGNVRVRPVY